MANQFRMEEAEKRSIGRFERGLTPAVQTKGIAKFTTAGIQADAQARRTRSGFVEAERVRRFGAGEVQKGREFQAEESRKAFARKTGFARELIGKFDQPGTATGADFQGPSESEQLLIQAQEEAGEKEVNRLQDILSDAGILSSGTLAVGTGEIIGSARAGVARTAAGFAESRLTRRHQQLLAKRQQLTQLISSILV